LQYRVIARRSAGSGGTPWLAWAHDWVSDPSLFANRSQTYAGTGTLRYSW
jgi:hypothetical protein